METHPPLNIELFNPEDCPQTLQQTYLKPTMEFVRTLYFSVFSRTEIDVRGQAKRIQWTRPDSHEWCKHCTNVFETTMEISFTIEF